jgi:hypothetical protein
MKPAVSNRHTKVQTWRNLLVLAINEGLRRELFTLRPDDNGWSPDRSERSIKFNFAHEGIPAVASVHDAGHGELSVKTALWPTAFGQEYIHSVNVPMKKMGEAYAWGYLARLGGAWLQAETNPSAYCSATSRDRVMALNVTPLGYLERRANPR